MMPDGLGKLSSLQSLSTFIVVMDDKNKKKVAGKLNELQNLINLRSNLEISGLDQVRDVRLESQDVNLMDKKFLESLDLNWDCRGKIEDTLQLLENLRPHQNLRRINVDDILVSSFLAGFLLSIIFLISFSLDLIIANVFHH